MTVVSDNSHDTSPTPREPQAPWASRYFGGNLIAPFRRFLGAVVISAGPWIVSVIALAVVSVTMTPVLGFQAVEDLRLTVIYAFCIAPLVAGPIGAILSRTIASEVEAGEIRHTPDLFLVAAIGSALIAECLALVVVVTLGIAPFQIATAFVFLTGAAALLWISFAALTALKAHRLLIRSFSSGMVFALICIMVATRGEVDTETLIWSFTSGISLSAGVAIVKVESTRGSRDTSMLSALKELLAEIQRLKFLCLAVLVAVAAVWADKWVAWLMPGGLVSNAGFLHYSPYDGIMFVAHLSAIPTYAALLLLHDSGLSRSIEAFRTTLTEGASYARIRSVITQLEHSVWSGIFSIVFIQAALTACIVLLTPIIVKSLDFSFEQFMALRVGIIGALLHSIFFLCCAVLLVCNRVKHFLILQISFLALNTIISVFIFVTIGLSAYGFFASAVIMSVASFFIAYRALANIDYLTFLGENDALYT